MKAEGHARRTAQVPPSRVLFNLDVRLGRGGETGRIVVHRGDHIGELTAKFIQEHGLAESVAPRLQKLLLQNLRIHRERQHQRHFR